LPTIFINSLGAGQGGLSPAYTGVQQTLGFKVSVKVKSNVAAVAIMPESNMPSGVAFSPELTVCEPSVSLYILVQSS